MGRDTQKTQRGELRIVFAVANQICRELFFQKLVVRFVIVESVDHIIAVAERERKIVWCFGIRSVGAVRIRIANNVQPHSCDVLTKLGAV